LTRVSVFSSQQLLTLTF